MSSLEGLIRYNKADFLSYRPGSGTTVEILDIHVDSVRRGEGVGRRMVEELVNRVKETEVTRVFAITRETNTIAREFYSGIGFHLMVMIPYFYGNDAEVESVRGDKNPHAVMYGRNLP